MLFFNLILVNVFQAPTGWGVSVSVFYRRDAMGVRFRGEVRPPLHSIFQKAQNFVVVTFCLLNEGEVAAFAEGKVPSVGQALGQTLDRS
jgi:hypothetical protein